MISKGERKTAETPATGTWAWLSWACPPVPYCLKEKITNKHRPKTATRKVTMMPIIKYLAAAAPSSYSKDAAILLSIENTDLCLDTPAPAMERNPKKPT